MMEFSPESYFCGCGDDEEKQQQQQWVREGVEEVEEEE